MQPAKLFNQATSAQAHCCKALEQRSPASHLTLRPRAATRRVSSYLAASEGSKCPVGADCCLWKQGTTTRMTTSFVWNLQTWYVYKTNPNLGMMHAYRRFKSIRKSSILWQVADWWKILRGLGKAWERSFQLNERQRNLNLSKYTENHQETTKEINEDRKTCTKISENHQTNLRNEKIWIV